MSKVSKDDYIFRGYNDETDRGFIFNSYLKSFRPNVAAPHWKYYKEHQSKMEKMVEKSHIIVAVHPEHKNDIFGWGMVEERDGKAIIHYIYIKQTFRNFGLMTEMLKQFNINWREDVLHVSHQTPTTRAMERKYGATIGEVDE